MITLEITDEQLQQALNKTLEKMLGEDNYSNPLQEMAKKAIGSTYSKGALTDAINAKIVAKVEAFIETDQFDLMLGQAVAKAIADREIDKTKKRL